MEAGVAASSPSWRGLQAVAFFGRPKCGVRRQVGLTKVPMVGNVDGKVIDHIGMLEIT